MNKDWTLNENKPYKILTSDLNVSHVLHINIHKKTFIQFREHSYLLSSVKMVISNIISINLKRIYLLHMSESIHKAIGIFLKYILKKELIRRSCVPFFRILNV